MFEQLCKVLEKCFLITTWKREMKACDYPKLDIISLSIYTLENTNTVVYNAAVFFPQFVLRSVLHLTSTV